MIDAAVVGLGRIGLGFQRDPLRSGVVSHAGAWSVHPAARLVAGVDPDPEQRAVFEEMFDRPAYPSWDEMVARHRPQVVSVATPPDSHTTDVVAAIDFGVDRVICEKPGTTDLSAVQRLKALLGANATKVGINFTRRYDPLHRRLLGLLKAEGLRGGSGHYTAGLRNTGSHWIDGIHQAGGTVDRVLAAPRIDGIDPTPDVVFDLSNGGRVCLMGHDVREYLVYETDLFGSTNRIRLGDSGTRATRSLVGPSSRYAGYKEFRHWKWSPPLGLSSPMLAVVDDAIVSLEEDRPMLCGLEDAIDVHRVIEAVTTSLAEGDWVEVGGSFE